MATDGVKIIDGDLARDTYGAIMDLYDSGVEAGTIKKEVPFVKSDYGEDTDFYHEIFVTAYALAFWEIGEITTEILDEVKRVAALGSGARVWTEEASQVEGRKRQRELDKLIGKISQPNLKIRKRKKYRVVTNFYFRPDDVLAFQLSDGTYRALICAKVTQQRGQCTYDLVATTYAENSKPTVSRLLDSFILGRRIGSGYGEKETATLQPGVREIWNYCKTSRPFIFGLAYHLVTHKDMVQLRNKFENIGTLRIKEPFKKDGSYGYESDFTRFEELFGDLDSHLKTWELERFPMRLICEI
jgi:hypothetical protein